MFVYDYETDIRIKKKITNARRKAQQTIHDLEGEYLPIKPPLRSILVYVPMPDLTKPAK